MKLILLTAIFGFAASHPAQEVFEPDLRPAVEQITALIDFDAIVEILHNIDLTTCDSYANISQFISSAKYETIHNHLWTDPEYLDIISFIANAGYPEIYDAFNNLFELLGLSFRVNENGPIKPATSSKPFTGPGIEPCNQLELAKKIHAIIPEEQLLAVVIETVDNDRSIQDLIVRIADPKKAESYKKLKALPEVQDLIEYAKMRGIPINEILYFIESVFGWSKM